MSIRRLSLREAHRNRVCRELELALEVLYSSDRAAYAVLIGQAWQFLVENSGRSDFPSILA